MSGDLEIDDDPANNGTSFIAIARKNRQNFGHEFHVNYAALFEVTTWCREHIPAADFARSFSLIWVKTDEQAVLLRLAHGEYIRKMDPNKMLLQ